MTCLPSLLGLCAALSYSNIPAAPYEAWNGEALPFQRAAELEAPPPPGAEEPEAARRTFEFVPELGVALPHCSAKGTDCEFLLPGTEAALSGLYRPSPYFAFGLAARFDAFSLTRAGAPGGLGATSLFAGAVARVYAMENGSIDPYLEVAVGAGARWLQRQRGAFQEEERDAFAAAGRLSAGIDFALGDVLRLGPVVAVSRAGTGSAVRCTDRICRGTGQSALSLPSGTTSFGLRVTFAAGERL